MLKRWNVLLILLLIAVSLSSSVVMAQGPTDGPVATVSVEATTINWQSQAKENALILTISGPEDFYLKEEFAAGSNPSFNLVDTDGTMYPDGSYTYELVTIPLVDAQVREIMDTVTEENRFAVEEQLRKSGQLPDTISQSGYFYVSDGVIITGDEDEGPFTEDNVILDDLIVDGSACIGQDCVNGESFGYDTLRLKENNLRIKAQDTSSSGSFPTNDWQITFNDSANGGANKFSIDDIDGGKTPFTLEASAPSNSLYVDSSGRVGLGTANPVVNAHIVEGNTPTIRLEQDGSSGFTPQTWDVAGNEANFFIRDVTNGSKLSFRIEPGAPQDSIHIDSAGNIGLGTSNPSEDLHVYGNDGTTSVTIQEASSTKATRTMLTLKNNGAMYLNLEDTSGNTWNLKFEEFGFQVKLNGSQLFKIGSDGKFQIWNSATEILNLDNAGNLTIPGNLTSANYSRPEGDRITQLEEKNAELEGRIAELERLIENLTQDGTSSK